MEKEKLYLDWHDYASFVKGAFKRIKDFGITYDVAILGIYRGGLPIAVNLSNLFQTYNKYIPGISIIKYQRLDSKENRIDTFNLKTLIEAKNVIIAEDIIDKGITMVEIIDLLKHELKHKEKVMIISFATYDVGVTAVEKALKELDVEHNIFSQIKLSSAHPKWVVFPWEF